MIATADGHVVCLGGRRGDHLFRGRPGEGLRPLAELGWDAAAQATPQRRLLLAGDSILVLEPVAGPVLRPPLRVRRFDLAGKETDRVEGEGDDGVAGLYFHHTPDGTLVRYGIDPATGRPTAWRGRLDLKRRLKPKPLSGTPLEADGAWWYAVRMEGVWRVAGDEVRFWRGEPGLAVAIDGQAVWPARDGRGAALWTDGVRCDLAGGRAFPPWTPPIFPWVAKAPDGRRVVLRRGGGALGWMHADGRMRTSRGPSLPPGLYTSLVALPEGVFALADGAEPRLVPVTF